MTDQPSVPQSPLTAQYAYTGSDRPHHLRLTLFGKVSTMSFVCLADMQAFVLAAQTELGRALGDGLKHVPPPVELDSVDQDFIDEAMSYLDDVKDRLDSIDASLDMASVASAVHDFVESIRAHDVDVDLDVDDVEAAIRDMREMLRAKRREIDDRRREAKANREALFAKLEDVDADQLAASAEMADHPGRRETLQ